ncbi:MAG: SDR family oxidoreductase [Actinomycetota bacterium]|nr:SDR family oxidoreductase [Actinomycetota bacterium]
MRRGPQGVVAVVTGASSGIARATALALARRGASVVLAARSEDSLREVADRCVAVGGRALAVPTDVAVEEDVQRLARRASDAFGRIDVWINAAAVMAYGGFEDIPAAEYRHVVETNLFGQVHGARAVLPHFRRQGRGVLINVGSVWGHVTSPYVSPYVVSKFGVRAFSECLQEGLRLGRDKDIHVCLVLAQSVDTPIFRHAGNYTGTLPKPIPPIVNPQRVVKAILGCVEHPRRQVTVGWWGRMLELGHAVTPAFYSRVVPEAMNMLAFGREPAAPTPGNIYEPMPQWNQTTGDWRDKRRAAARAAVLVGAAATTAAVTRSLRRSNAVAEP